jgi:hypothetical protein
MDSLMGFELQPVNPEVDELHFGMFTWPWILDSGVGLAIGYMREPNSTKYLAFPKKVGDRELLPNFNDGYPVNNAEAILMAFLAEQLYDLLKDGVHDLNPTLIDALKTFADFALASGGFTIT